MFRLLANVAGPDFSRFVMFRFLAYFAVATLPKFANVLPPSIPCGEGVSAGPSMACIPGGGSIPHIAGSMDRPAGAAPAGFDKLMATT